MLFLTIIIVILLFGFVVLFGAPYLPTLSGQQSKALELLDLKPGQVLVELGSGDGRMQIVAAKKGIKSIGYELNPLLVIYSKIICFKYRHLAKVQWANFWRVNLPECDGIYVFLLDKYMSKLHKKITQEITKPVKVVSFAFKIPDVEPATEADGLFMYKINNKK